MTAHALHQDGAEAPPFSVVGTLRGAAVSHVGILVDAATIKPGQSVDVFHMASPTTLLQLPGSMDAHAVAWIDDLTVDERIQIQDWLDQMRTTSLKIEYYAYPAADVTVDQVTGCAIGRRFSCSGFVNACFEEALKLKIVAGEDDLPEVAMSMILEVWPFGERRVRRYLQGQGPWRVLLPSYLFHALTKQRSDMPHLPLTPNPCFP